MHLLSRLALAGAAAIAALALATLLAGPALAADPTVRLQATQGDDGGWILSAQVHSANGDAVSNATVDFAVQVTFMGADRSVVVGSATTDTSGAASLEYTPTLNGRQVLTATVHGTRAVSAPTAIDVTGAVPVLPADPPTLSLLGEVTPLVAVVVVLTVWLLLGGTFLYAVLGVARARPGAKRRTGVSVPVITSVERRRRAEMG